MRGTNGKSGGELVYTFCSVLNTSIICAEIAALAWQNVERVALCYGWLMGLGSVGEE